MKMLKKIMSLCLTLAIITSFSITAFATELAGDDVVECKVSITLTDRAGDYSGNNLVVNFKDITGTSEKSVTLTKDNSWGSGQRVEFTLPAPTTYNITFEGISDEYEIVDTRTNSLAVTSFAASASDVNFQWSIAKQGQIENNENQAATSVDRENITVKNEDAEAVYREFLDAVSFIETDPTWNGDYGTFLGSYSDGSINYDTFSQYYVDYVEGGTPEKYAAMSPYERFLWTRTYTIFAYAVNSNWGFNHYFESKDTFKKEITDYVIKGMYGNNSETVKEAYLKLADWQYEYIKENGVPFNFINNRSYIDEVGSAPVQNENSDELTDEERKELEEIRDSIDETLGEKDKGIWDDTMTILSKNFVTIIILIVLCCALGVVVYIRKSKNVDNDIDDKN